MVPIVKLIMIYRFTPVGEIVAALHLAISEDTIYSGWWFTIFYKVGPYPLISRVITPLLGATTPFITIVGAHPVAILGHLQVMIPFC